MGLLDVKPVRTYKPFNYPWAYEFFKLQEKMRWLPEEVPLGNDVKDYNTVLSAAEVNLITQIFRFFTQQDTEINGVYGTHYLKVFQPTEVQMMLCCFMSVELIHMDAYSILLDTVGMPEVEYQTFLQYKEMKDKYDYLHTFSVHNKHEIARSMAAFSAFTEGLQLYASFAILMSFPRRNLMKGMGQIITWSIRDEAIHVAGVLKLFQTFVEENPEVWTQRLIDDIYEIGKTMVDHEDRFIDLAFEMGDLPNLSAAELKQYIRYIADRRFLQLGMSPHFKVKENPLPWMDEVTDSVEFVNFFEEKSTSYARAASEGIWEDAWNATSEMDD